MAARAGDQRGRPHRPRRRAGEWALALLVSAGCVWVAVRGVDLGAVGARLGTLAWGWTWAYVLALTVVQICRARRWLVLTAPFAALGARGAWRTANVGTLFTLLLPLRLGELVRPAMMQREHQVPFAATLGAVAVERVLDGLVVMLLFFAAGAFVAWPAGMPRALALAARLATCVFVAAGVGLAVAWRARARVGAALGRWGRAPGAARRLAAAWEAGVAGLGALPGPATMARVVGWTATYWAANALASGR